MRNRKMLKFDGSKNVITITRVYPKVSGLAAWSDNCKWYSSLHQAQLYRYFVNQSIEFCRHNLCVTSERVFIFVVVYFVIDSVRKLLDTPSYMPY
jgi:hypothetical protein